MSDRRLTPATDRVALESLRGTLERPTYTPGRPARLVIPVADLLNQPDGRRERQVNFGTDVLVVEDREGFSFVQSQLDGYCGWLRSDALTDDLPAITHRIRTPGTHRYPEANLKSREISGLSIGALVSVTDIDKRFARLTDGTWVPEMHLTTTPATDPAEVAQTLLGTPYLWGGNSRWGIDCSGLAQASLLACGIACPGDSDMQEKAFAKVDDIRRNDLLFWPGHVALALDGEWMIHATANVMAVTVENIASAIARIDAAGEGPFLGARRPDPALQTPFP